MATLTVSDEIARELEEACSKFGFENVEELLKYFLRAASLYSSPAEEMNRAGERFIEDLKVDGLYGILNIGDVPTEEFRKALARKAFPGE